MMRSTLGRDIAGSIALLEHLPPSERADWVPRIERENYRYAVGTQVPGAPARVPALDDLIASVAAELGPAYPLTITAPPDAAVRPRIDLHARLADGTPITIMLSPSAMPMSPWLPAIALIQFCILAIFTWVAVLLATRPLAQLARAADLLPGQAVAPLDETGPVEVARAARAFNAMQRRIAGFLDERVRILAAIAHDLQTPITRMRLRTELMEEEAQRGKFLDDLQAMQVLVEEGITYASSAHGLTEVPRKTDLDALLASLVYDYTDAALEVSLHGALDRQILTRPHAVRRVLTNLVDNALKFGSAAELHVAFEAAQRNVEARVVIRVCDRGPGIDPALIETVFEPFYRIEHSRNRDTGGSGLGLAIARRLADALGGGLALANREGGGLEARFWLPAPP